MSADWTTCRVVRDCAGHAVAVAGVIAMHLTGPRAGLQVHVDRLHEFGPLTPVLDADGLPVVRTVGDLTARHVGKRVRLEGREGHLERLDCGWIDGRDALILDLDSGVSWANLDLDTPAEVLS